MPENSSIHELVAANFGPVAAAYGTSPGHANKEALDGLVELISPSGEEELLDIATGAGNVALAFAPRVKRVVAFDLTPSMLEHTLERAAGKGLTNVEGVQGIAEDMPFDDSSFDIVTVRLAPHHYADIQKGVDEMARVVRPGGRVLIVDTSVPENDAVDAEINTLELLRDNSHVRDYRPSEWRSMVETAGLEVLSLRVDFYEEELKMDFDTWVERIRTPQPEVEELRRRFRAASPELKEAIQLEFKGDKIKFVWPQVTLVATKR